MIVTNAEALGLLIDIKDKKYVKLDAAGPVELRPKTTKTPADEEEEQPEGNSSYDVEDAPEIPVKAPTDPETNNQVFITHGKNEQVVEQIKKILTYRKFEPIVSTQRQTVSKPVPEKVIDDMRSCSAGIVHVGID